MDNLPQDIPVEPFSPFDFATANIMRYRKQRSVNLGSCCPRFVHENWITPSVFECASGDKVSELDIASGQNARAILENHWNSFISESDLYYLSSIGINTIRLPIGYWSLPGFCKDTPFSDFADVYHNSWSFIVHAINMAAKFRMGVLVDLHGAPGSQNGQPHSGISDKHVGLFKTSENMEKTLAILTFLTQQLCNVTNVVGIQILNEPQNNPALVDFCELRVFHSEGNVIAFVIDTRAVSAMRQVSSAAEAFPIYVHDGFNLEEFSDFIAGRTDFIVQDHHSYFVFTPQDESKPASQHTKEIETSMSASLATASVHQRGNLVVDEWSCALTPQSLSNEPDEAVARQNFCTTQMEVYSTTTAGWSFWTYKKEGCDSDPAWCFTTAVGTSLPSDFFVYGQSSNSRRSISNPVDTSIEPSTRTTPSRDLPANTSLPFFRQRLAVIHSRRTNRDIGDTKAEQQSSTRGYLDGALTARLFYEFDASKLGFTGQYVEDTIRGLGPDVIAPSTEAYYHTGFMRGLSDGEAQFS
ncbi:glycoside hydrolase superfamily [Mycena belliarum]|uniref:Glycoside hydrolase superfamily n=1 Tax=Mycena belliarum TaxID=1033014 RepID=A0AAD6UBI4_9AGAR|nr:glycoside hydrolase superfamily [Mycena belliae]